MTLLALITCDEYPQLDEDSRRLLPALQAAGLAVELVSWQADEKDWARFDAAVIRSTWDYYKHRPAFLAWLEDVAAHTRLLNPAPMLVWNTDKTYLADLAEQGLPIVPTTFLQAGSEGTWHSAFDRFACERLVIKPTVSGAGWNTFLLDSEALTAQQTQLDTLLSERDMMIQPYLPAIETAGEVSLIYFNRVFSHAVVKRPAPKEFRIQEHFGGITQAFSPDEETLALGDRIIAALPDPLLYARVDLMQLPSGAWAVSELEATEPCLFLAHDEQAPLRFVQALQAQLTPAILSR